MRRHAKASSAGTTWRQALGFGNFFRGAAAIAARSLSGSGSGAPSYAPAGGSRGRVAALSLMVVAVALLVIAPSAVAAKIPGGPPVAIFGPEAGSCALKALATGSGDLSGATGKGDKAILATGSGKRTSGSPTITDLTTTTGTFTVGEAISGTGIPVGTTIEAVGAGELTMSANATSGSGTTTTLTSGSKTLSNVTTTTGTFTVGQPISGTGIAAGTTISAVGGSTLTLSIGVTSAGTGITLTAGTKEVTNLSTGCGAFAVGQTITGAGIPATTTIAAVGAGTLTLSKQPTAGGTGVALSATSAFAVANNPQTLAVDEAAHRLYVYDNNPAFKIYAFSSPGLTGAIAGFPLAVAGTLGFSSAIAVDNTELPSVGRLYFADRASRTVYAFEPDGTELNIGNGFPNFPLEVPNLGPSFVPDLCGAAIDSEGNLWIGDENYYTGSLDARIISKFSSSGAPLDSIQVSQDRSSCGLGFDSEDNLYVSPDSNQISGASGRVWKYTAASDYEPLLATPLSDAGSISVAVDKGRNLFYTPLGNFQGGTRVQVRTTEGDLLGEFAQGVSTRLQSVALDETGERVYVSDRDSNRIYAFGFVTTPNVVTGVASGTDSTHETLRGKVNPLSIAVTDCHFEYTPESEFEIFGFGHAVSVPCAPSPGLGSGDVDVSADLSGLPPATSYRVRLVAGNSNGRTIGATKTFTTLGPVISGERAADVTSTSATLEAKINPNGEGTSYQFQYVGQADFEDSGWAKAASVPAGVVGLGSGTSDVLASQPISGLTAGAAYHFRAVATNASATLGGRGSAFTALVNDGSSCANAALRSGTSAHLPDCRAYEQVSPIDKGGFDIDSKWPVLSGPGGGDVAYASTGGFADSKAAGYPVAYAAHRTDTWRTEGISPPLEPVTDIFMGTVFGASADFRKQLVATNAKLTADTPEEGVQLYVHDSTDDSYEYVTTIPLNPSNFGPLVSAERHVVFRGASSDGSSFFFSVPGEGSTGEGFSLDSTPPPPATAVTNLYEFSGGELKLVGILPDDTTPVASGAQAAGVFTDSYDGPAAVRSHPVASDGVVYWTGGGSLYRREGGHSTLIASGASWRGATPDGSVAFYQREGSLYRYDATTETSTDMGVGAPGGRAVLGFSDDGEYVYFFSPDAYAPGAFPTGEDGLNIYAWHNGDTRLIARMPEAVDFLTESPADWRVSANGRYLGFLTGNQMYGDGVSFDRMPPAEENNGAPYVRAFFYDYEADSLVCASCVEGEGAPTRNVLLKQPYNKGVNLHVFEQQLGGASDNASNAGQLFFNTVEPLVPGDTNEKYDVYEYQAGAVRLISSGQDNNDSWFGDATPSGDDVFFTTREGLVGQDTDPNIDLYVAKVNGGLASQAASAQGAVCQDAEQCHAAPTTAPSGAGPGTSVFEAPPQAPVARCGAGKVRRGERCVRRPRCRAGKVRRRGRCVKRKSERKARRRAAGHDRRAGK